MPVFLALYWVLLESVELRQAPFILWIDDLAAMDPYFVLPILMGVSMYFVTAMQPEPPDPMQAKIFKWMPIVFTFFFIWFPNLLGLTPLGINVTGNIAITFCLALITFVITTLVGKKYYWKHIFWMPGVPWPMKIILAPIELLGLMIKPFSLMIRLYANISAGHIVLMSLIALIFLFKKELIK